MSKAQITNLKNYETWTPALSLAANYICYWTNHLASLDPNFLIYKRRGWIRLFLIFLPAPKVYDSIPFYFIESLECWIFSHFYDENKFCLWPTSFTRWCYLHSYWGSCRNQQAVSLTRATYNSPGWTVPPSGGLSRPLHIFNRLSPSILQARETSVIPISPITMTIKTII